MSGKDCRFFTEEGSFDLRQAPWLRGFRCRYLPARYSDDLFAHHGVPLPPDLSLAVPARKGEFLAGRHAALKALQRWGLEGRSVPIGRLRSPIWPVGWVGSITHDGATAICATARLEDCRSLGIDLATWFSPSDAAALSPFIIQPEETQMLAKCALPRAQALTLAFSAKESLFKALCPTVGTYFDFHAIELLALDLVQGWFVARTRIGLSPSLVSGFPFQGAFQFGAEAVFTAAWLRIRSAGSDLPGRV